MNWGSLVRAIRGRKWRFARLILNNLAYAITHRNCRQCGKRKSWLESRCYSCQWNNFMNAMEVTPEEREQIERGILREHKRASGGGKEE